MEFRVQLTNVGLAQRPDLFDEHTVHWHGFKNVIPFFDGEPTGSVSIPQGQTFTYVYLSHDPGTYMFHCHVEDTEHVQMGMTGLVFVRPAQDGNTSLYPSGKYAYNDGDGSTGLRPRVRHVPERGVGRLPLGRRPHPAAGMERLPGRLQPPQRAGLPGHAAAERLDRPDDDTFVVDPARDADWNLRRRRPGRPDLDSQPLSSLVTCNAGERVLLRFANLGFMEAAMTLTGLKARVVGRDATPMRGRDRLRHRYETNTLSFGAGESFDAIFTAPAFSGGTAERTGLRHLRPLQPRLHPRRQPRSGDGGGQRTEIRVYPAGTLPAQQYPNQHPDDVA